MKRGATTILCPGIIGLVAACGTSSGGSGAEGGDGAGGTTETGGTATGGSTSSGGLSASGGETSSSGGSEAGGSAVGGDTGSGGAGGFGVEPPCCQGGGPGLSDCGAEDESCCSSPEVPGGTISRRYARDGGTVTNATDAATVSDFRLDKYLVTVGRFRKFVAAWDQGDGEVPVV